MAAYYLAAVTDFLAADPNAVLGQLLAKSRNVDAQQTRAWREGIQVLRGALRQATSTLADVIGWTVLLEYPLLRVGKRLDVVLIGRGAVLVIEFKVGSASADSASRRQVEDYVADLRDFHAPSRDLYIVPVLCPTLIDSSLPPFVRGQQAIERCLVTSPKDLHKLILSIASECTGAVQIDGLAWDNGAYRPVPTIIEAARMLYLTHSVDEIRRALSTHANLTSAADELVKIAQWARDNNRRAIAFVTGVPGSGKTLVGLNVAHDPRFNPTGSGDAAFLSGNSPLVAVLQEALARDAAETRGTSLRQERSTVRAEIQHLMRYLEEYLDHLPNGKPHEHVVVFDEAQRAWDANYGRRKFGRTAAEPRLLLDIMSRHTDWALIIGLVGGGQEINTGENGLSEWGKALIEFNATADARRRWHIFGSKQVIEPILPYTGTPLWEHGKPEHVHLTQLAGLHLSVAIRSHRNEIATDWISAVLDGRELDARRLSREVSGCPMYLTRSLEDARHWLRTSSTGNRTYGLAATSGARRLRGYGLGVTLNANDLDAIKHWFLADPEDVRSSRALEVTGNEFAVQGLELDRIGVCWDQDMVWSPHGWVFQQFKGPKWQAVRDDSKQNYVRNSYRVLLSRAREGLVVWVPPGEPSDPTRPRRPMDATANYLRACGLIALDDALRTSGAVSA